MEHKNNRLWIIPTGRAVKLPRNSIQNAIRAKCWKQKNENNYPQCRSQASFTVGRLDVRPVARLGGWREQVEPVSARLQLDQGYDHRPLPVGRRYRQWNQLHVAKRRDESSGIHETNYHDVSRRSKIAVLRFHWQTHAAACEAVSRQTGDQETQLRWQRSGGFGGRVQRQGRDGRWETWVVLRRFAFVGFYFGVC